MDFSYNENQQMLSDSVDRFLTDRHDFSVRRALLDDRTGQDRIWREMAELGWIGAAFPEELGGFGGSGADILAVMEHFGRHLVGAPFVTTAVIGGRLLIDGLAGERRESLIGRVIAGELHLALMACGTYPLRSPEYGSISAVADGDGFVLNGRMSVVLNGDRANLLLVAARTAGANGDLVGMSLFMVEGAAVGVSRRGFRTVDGHMVGEVVLADVRCGTDAVMGQIGQAVPLINRALDFGIVAVCGEAMGSAAYLVNATAEYLRTREQYGAPLSRFQVLQHRMADMYIASETARSMAAFAALSLDQDDAARGRDVSAAKVQVIRSARFVAQNAVQLHGGMGVSEELDIGHHFMRAVVLQQLFGDEGFHLRRFADLSEAIDRGLATSTIRTGE